MKTRTLLVMLALATLVTFGTTSCKKKGKGESKGKDKAADMAADMASGGDMKAPMAGMDAKRPMPRPRPAAAKGLFDPTVLTVALAMPAKKHPAFARTADELVKVAAKCKKAKKYINSFTWCDDWKKLAAKIKKAMEAIDKSKSGTVEKAMAMTLAGVSKLRDPDEFVRYAGLQVLEQALYNFSYKKLRKPRPMLAKIIALSVKDGKSYDERKQAIRLLGCDGGLSHFNGDKYDGKVLAWAAHKDKSHWVRRAALGHLSACVKRLGDKCPVKPAQLKKWAAAEKDGDSIEGIAKIAGQLKMTEEVFKWCEPRLMESKLYWGCRTAFKAVLGKAEFDKFHALAKKFRDSDKSKTKNNFRMVFVVQIMFHGLKNGFPKDKVIAFVDSVLAQEETATLRSKATTADSINGLVKIANDKTEIKLVKKLLKKRARKYKKFVKKDKDRKDWVKLFKEADKKLKEKAKALKKAK